MRPETRLILELAFSMLQELRRLDLEATPGAAIHTAYYVAFHAARAVLSEAHGTVSAKHGTVHTAFEALAKTESKDLLILAYDLRTTYEARLLRDYIGRTATAQTASAAAAVAEKLFAAAARRLGFPNDTA